MSKLYTCYSVGPEKDTPRHHYWTDPETGVKYIKRKVVAFQGLCRVEAEADDFFGGDESKPYRSRVVHNPTWGDLYRMFATQMGRTNDQHHCFLEGARVTRIEMEDGHPVKILELSLGS